MPWDPRMTDVARFLLLFACGWLLAALWLVLMGRLLNQLSRNDPAAYAALGKPVMRWLWWRWPAFVPGSGPRLLLQARGRLDLSTMYSVEEVGSIAKVALWIVLNRPNLAVSRTTRRQQQQLLACAFGFVLCLLGVVLLALLGSARRF